MEEAEGMVTHHRIKITLHNKNIMANQEEIAECSHRIVEEGFQVQRKGRRLLMVIGVAMIRGVAKVEDIQMEARRLEGDSALHHWSDRLLQILEVSRVKEHVGFTLMIHSKRTTRAYPTETIKNTTNVSGAASLGQPISNVPWREKEDINI
jgi:hypothetical protein